MSAHTENRSSMDYLVDTWRSLLQKIHFYHQELLSNREDESLHQLRIAARRSIVLMDEFRSVSKSDQIHLHRKTLKKMIDISNHKRDLDVMRDYFHSLGKVYDDVALQQLNGYLKEMQIQADRKLFSYLQSVGYSKGLESWKAYLEKVSKNDCTAEGEAGIQLLSKKVIYERFSVIKEEIIFLDKKKRKRMKDLHALRISYKKLRYLLETFSSLYKKHELRSLLKQIKKIQNLLGHLHDNYQQKEVLERVLENEKNKTIKNFIKDTVYKDMKRSKKREKLEVARELKKFLDKEALYKDLFA